MGRKDKEIPFEVGRSLPLGARLRYARQQKGITLTQMAQDLGYTKSHLSAIENGNGHPSPQLLEKYERKLGLGLGVFTREVSDQSALGRRRTHSNGAGVSEVQEEYAAPASPANVPTSRGHIEDWGDAPSEKNFYGRKRELAELREWITVDARRVVVLSGIGGVGKTALANAAMKKLAQTKDGFTAFIWRSLQHTPSLESVLRDCIRSLSGQRHVKFPTHVEDQIALFIEYLQRFRCFIVFDNFESVLQAGSLSGEYQQGYEAYGALIEHVGRAQHQSCLLLTSREKPNNVARLEVEEEKVRSLPLSGVGEEEGQSILKDNHLAGSKSAFTELVRLYSGNPLALRLVAASIRDLFSSNIDAFLEVSRSRGDGEDEAIIVGDVANLLGQQFQRLSEQERSIMYWLAIEREGMSSNDLQDDGIRLVSRGMVVQTLEMLRHRSMIEAIGSGRFTLQPAIMEYVTDSFINRVYDEIVHEKMEVFAEYLLMKAQGKDYLRSIQKRIILAPIAHRLLTTFGKEESENKLRNLLGRLHETQTHTPGYAAGNILNLLIELGCDLRGYDFSHLFVWQAYLQQTALPEVNFAHAELGRSVFTDTFERVLTAKLSPDGMRLAAGTGNGDVHIWDATGDTPMPLHICRGHTDWVRSIAFSHDGKMLVSGSDDLTIRLWDVETGECLQKIKGQSRVFAVAFHRNGNILAAGNQDGTVSIWGLREEQYIYVLKGHASRVWSVDFSPNGEALASGSSDSTARLWDVKTGRCLHELKGHRHRIRSVAFSGDGALLASGSKDRTVRIWDVKTGALVRELRGPARGIRSVAFSPSARILACGCDDRTIRLWDADTGHLVKTVEGHANWIRSVAFAPGGKTFVTSSEDQTVRLWDAHTGRCLKTLQGYTEWVYAVAFNPNGKIIATGSGDLTVRLWEVSTGQPMRALHGHTDWIRSVAFSPNGELLVGGGEDTMMRLWKVSTGEYLRKLDGHTGWVYAVAFSPNGELIASGSEDHTVCLWQVSTGQLLETFRGHPDWIRSVAFSPDGKLLASGSEDCTVRLWRVSTGQLLKTLEGHTGRIYAVAFSPDGELIASGSEEGIVKLWSVDTRQDPVTLQGHTGRVWSIAFSPNERLFASGGEDRMVRLWDVSTGQLLKTFAGFSNRVYSTAFSPDGSTVAGGSHDGTVKLWSVDGGELVQTLRSERPYEGMNITGVEGLVAVQKDMLKALGAVEQ